MNELKIPFGIHKKTGKVIHINEITKETNGLKCNCKCPDPVCGADLMARIGTGKREPHFSHVGGNCKGNGLESGKHKYAKQVISEAKTMKMPNIEYRGSVIKFGEIIHIDRVEIEKSTGEFRPDAIVYTSEGTMQKYIEFYHTHKVDDEKREKIRLKGVDAIEINLSGLSIDSPEAFKKDLLYSIGNKIWLYSKEKEDLVKQILLEEEKKRRTLEKQRELKRIEYEKLKLYQENEDKKRKKQLEEINKEKEKKVSNIKKQSLIDKLQIDHKLSRIQSEEMLTDPDGPDEIVLPFLSCHVCQSSGTMIRKRVREKTYIIKCTVCGYESMEKKGP